MTKKIVFLVACFSLFFVTSVCANPDGVLIRSGDLRISELGSGLVFPDGSVQYKAAEQVYKPLIHMVTEEIGTTCTNGGIKFQLGLDVDGNNVLDSIEVTQTKYLCNGTSVTYPANALVGSWFHRADLNSSNQTLTLTETTWQNNDAGNEGCIESGFYTYNDTSVTFTYGLNGGCRGEAANSTSVFDYTVSAATLNLIDPQSGDLIVSYNK